MLHEDLQASCLTVSSKVGGCVTTRDGMKSSQIVKLVSFDGCVFHDSMDRDVLSRFGSACFYPDFGTLDSMIMCQQQNCNIRVPGGHNNAACLMLTVYTVQDYPGVSLLV
eukprot:TRINITY_DN62_c0_g3_i1.p2 TRINITY_DN62_c0_g3~~TRINITY_DN62_c0_g3_i1.p2  ORF type:complete len:110 (-),score=22.87 TRINITY_DN62_c0_g3_i1:217-546(-)